MKKYSKLIFGGGIAALLLLGLVLLARPEGSPGPEPQQAAGAVVNRFDFGRISMTQGLVSYVYELPNDGNLPVTISRVYTSCMCTTAYLLKDQKRLGPFGMPGHGTSRGVSLALAPGEKVEVEVVYDPAAHGPAGLGRVERAVKLETAEGPSWELSFTAEVAP